MQEEYLRAMMGTEEVKKAVTGKDECISFYDLHEHGLSGSEKRGGDCPVSAYCFDTSRQYCGRPDPFAAPVCRRKRTFPDTTEEEWERFINIVQKASFSRSEISDGEVQTVYGIYDKNR